MVVLLSTLLTHAPWQWRSAPRPALGRGGGGCPPQPADACTMPMTLFTSKVLEELLISRGGVETTVL